MVMLAYTTFQSMFSEVVSFAFEEGCLLILAAIAYIVATGAFKGKGASSKNQSKSATTSLNVLSKPQLDLKTSTLQALTRAVRDGCTEEAISAVIQHKSESTGVLPVALGAKLILLLAQKETVKVSPNATELIGQVSTASLEKVLTEAWRRNDVSQCRKIRDMSDMLKIEHSTCVFEILAKATCNSAELETIIAEIDNRGLAYTKSLVEAILLACATLKDADIAGAVLAKAELPRSDKDLCAALINVYASCEQWDMAICVYEEVMVPARLKIDSKVVELLVQAATETSHTELLATLAECTGNSGELVKQARAVRQHGKGGDLAGALAVFNTHKAQANSLFYNSILEACVCCNDLPKALQYFQEAKELGLVDTVSFNIVMKGQLAAGDTRAAHQLLGEMTDRGLFASLVTYHKLLNVRVQAHDLRGAWRLVEDMHANKLTPNAVTYSILLKAFTAPMHAKDLKEAMKLVDAMESPLDEVLFASVAEACIRTGRLDILSERTQQYKNNGGLQGLTAPTYGSMIKAYGQAHDIEQVWSLWDEMAKRQVRPTSITLGCMVEALVMNRRCDQAYELVESISADASQKALLNTVIYSTILKGFAMAKRLDRLMVLYEEMRTSGIVCNTITYNTMLNAFAQCGDMNTVPQLLDDMKKAIPPVEPDIVTYSTMVKGFCTAGDVDKGLKLLRDMQQSNLAPDEVMFNSLLDGCARQHRLEDALQLLETMKAAGVTPSNYTLSIMVKLLGRARRLNQAFVMVKSTCEEHGFRANVQVYTCLIQACFHNRQLAKAVGLHDQIVEEGCVLDQKAYVSLARGCVMAGAVDKAADVVRCAHHIPGHGLVQPRGRPVGVDPQCLDDVLAKLGRNSEAAKRLAAEVAAAQAGDLSATQTAPWRKPAHRGAGESGPMAPAKREMRMQGKAPKQGSNFIRDSFAVVSAC